MKTFIYLISALSTLSGSALATCCYNTKLSTQTANTATLSLTVTSSKAQDLGKYTVRLGFPQTIVVADNPVSSVSGFKCAKNLVDIGKWDCSTQSKVPFTAVFSMTAAAFTGGVPLTVTAMDETCNLSESSCPLFDTAPKTGTTVTKGDTNSNMINLGALGMVQPEIFWPVLVGILLTFAGCGVLYYVRGRNQVVTGDDEAQMTESKNGAGWFGEKVDPHMKPNAKGYVGSRQAAVNLSQSNITEAVSSPKRSTRSQRPERKSRENRHNRPVKDDDSSDEEDMRRVVKVKRAERKISQPIVPLVDQITSPKVAGKSTQRNQ